VRAIYDVGQVSVSFGPLGHADGRWEALGLSPNHSDKAQDFHPPRYLNLNYMICFKFQEKIISLSVS